METRLRNASRNLFFGLFLKMYQVLMPFVMRTVMLYFMGIQYLGLNSLFTSVLQVLNLAELGVGSAMVFCMYKPIVEKDEEKICALLNLYKNYYRIIGCVILIIGCLLTPLIPKLVGNEVPKELNIYTLYILNLLLTVLSYWLFAYKSALMQAHQRADVISKITILVSTVGYIIQIVIICIFRNYYLYVIALLLMQIVNNIFVAIIATKMYPKYRPIGKLSTEEKGDCNSKIRALVTSKIGTVFGVSVDTIVISSCLGLTMLAIYQNYYYILNAIVGFILVIFQSCTAGIGNSLVVESSEKNYIDFRKFFIIILWICTVSISCMIGMYQPFMKKWVGNEFMLPDLMVVLFCIYFFFIVVQNFCCVYKDAAGIWKQDRYRPLISGIVNLILNIAFVKVWGIYAIVLSTIASYIFIALPWIVRNLFKFVFKRSSKEFLRELIWGFLISAEIGFINWLLCGVLPCDGWLNIVFRMFVSLFVSNFLFILIKHNDVYFNSSLELINRITRNKFDKIIILLMKK